MSESSETFVRCCPVQYAKVVKYFCGICVQLDKAQGSVCPQAHLCVFVLVYNVVCTHMGYREPTEVA